MNSLFSIALDPNGSEHMNLRVYANPVERNGELSNEDVLVFEQEIKIPYSAWNTILEVSLD